MSLEPLARRGLVARTHRELAWPDSELIFGPLSCHRKRRHMVSVKASVCETYWG